MIDATPVPGRTPQPTRTTTVAAGGVEVTLEDRNRTRPFLVLHGGGGAGTVRGFADLLAERTHSRVLVPTHPGFGGTTRPAGLVSTPRSRRRLYRAARGSGPSRRHRSSVTASAVGSPRKWRC